MSAPGILHHGVDGWPLFSHEELLAYDNLYTRLDERALAKLRSGEWVASGIRPQYGPEARQIATHLWDFLEIEHRLEYESGSGFHFIALMISSVQPRKTSTPQIKEALLRSQSTEWISAQAECATSPPLRHEQLAAARDAFRDVEISDNLFRECRRAAQLSLAKVQRGRPKAKG